jgi:hypothetical protein
MVPEQAQTHFGFNFTCYRSPFPATLEKIDPTNAAEIAEINSPTNKPSFLLLYQTILIPGINPVGVPNFDFRGHEPKRLVQPMIKFDYR